MLAFRRTSLVAAAGMLAAFVIGGPLATSALASAGAPAPATTAQKPADVHAAALAAARARAAAKVRAQNHVRASVVALAKSKVGARYVRGASGPRQFDCSGLARYVYAHAAHRSLPHYSKAQFAKMRHVAARNRKPGDLVFFFRRGMSHVGIYIGAGKMVNAQSPRSGVRVAALSARWIAPHYSGAGALF